ncbi:MAG: GLUG motif-containing protein, partial [Syntrophomonas sp.]
MYEKAAKRLVALFLTLILMGVIFKGLDYNLKAYAADPVDSWSNYIEEPPNDGTTFTIEKEEQLAWVANQVNSGTKTFSGCTLKLVSSLKPTFDLSTHYWVPIGDASHAFKGTFDGNSIVISGLKIGSSSAPDAALRYAGLFGNVNAAVITNVCLENMAIYTSYGSSSSTPRIGGIVGYMNGNSTLSGCRATGILYSSGEYASIGGMLGYFDGQNSESLTVKNCYSQCSISGTRLLNVGCLAGSIVGKTKNPAFKIIIKNCFATGTVVGGYYGTTYIGGLAGNCQYVKIYNSYSNCIIKGQSGYFGGFAGYSKYSAFLNDYAAGSTSAPYSAGGFMGLKYGSGNTLSNCYWNSSGAAYGIGNNTDTGTEKLDDMQLSSFLDKLNSNGAALKVSESDPDIVTWVQTADKNGGYPRLEDIGAFTTVYEPILSDAAISGEARIEKTLTIGYTYTDLNGYPDSGTTFQWYRSANPDGSGGVPITGATQKTYTLTSDDVAQYIYAVVAPSNGLAAGTAVTSSCTSQIDGPYFAGGSGISSDPYKIKTLAQLKNVTAFADIYHYYDLENDIVGLDEVLGGVTNKVFAGDFDGNGYTVTLAIPDQPDSYWNVGMFGTIGSNGYVHDLNIAGSITESVYGPQAVGSLAGLNQGTIENCNSSAAVTITGGSATSARLGGLVGDNSGSITNCSVTGTVGAINQIGKTNSKAMIGGIAGNNYYLLSPGLITGCHTDIHSFSIDLASFNEVHAGGLVGLNESGSTITNCYTDHGLQCSLTPEKETSIVRIGGIAGYNNGANISKCYVTGNVTGNGNCNIYSGGLVGQCGFAYPFTYSNISESFYSGTVAGRGGSSKDTRVGGLAGYFDSGNISYCYSSGSVNGNGGGSGTGNVYSGGLIGYNHKGSAEHCYTRSSGTATGGGADFNGGLYGRSQTYSPTCYWNQESTTANYGEAVSSSSIPSTTLTTTQMTGANASSSMSGLDFTTPYFVAKDNQSEYRYYPQLNVFATSADGKVRDASLQSVTSVVYASAINIADIPGIKSPAIAQLPTYTTETAQYAGSICWSPNGIPFSADTVYSAKITLIPKAGFTLEGVKENFFKVAGADSTSNSANSGVVIAVFPATAKIKNAVINPTTAVFNLLNPSDVSTV